MSYSYDKRRKKYRAKKKATMKKFTDKMVTYQGQKFEASDDGAWSRKEQKACRGDYGQEYNNGDAVTAMNKPRHYRGA